MLAPVDASEASIAATAEADIRTHGTLLHSYAIALALVRSQRLAPIIQSVQSLSATKGGLSFCVCIPLQILSTCPTDLPFLGEVMALAEEWLSVRSGPLLRAEECQASLKQLALHTRRDDQQSGHTSIWLPDFQRLLYRICVNEGARQPVGSFRARGFV